MVLKLYGTNTSPPVRSSLLTLKALGLDFELKTVNTNTGDHLTPGYLKINPLHTIPALEDGNFVIWDSHAINAYLVGKYGKEDSLYPVDLQKRAVIDQRLHFDSGVLFISLRKTILPVLKEGANILDTQSTAAVVIGHRTGNKQKKLAVGTFDVNQPDFRIGRHVLGLLVRAVAGFAQGGYTSLETLLERSKYVAGDQLSIADFSIVTTITSSNLLVPIVPEKFPKIVTWLKRMQALPYYTEANQVGLDNFDTLIRSKMA